MGKNWITVRFVNKSDRAIELMVEPWGTSEMIAPEAPFAIHYTPPEHREDTSHAEVYADMIRFWVEGDTYEIEIDGVRLDC